MGFQVSLVLLVRFTACLFGHVAVRPLYVTNDEYAQDEPSEARDVATNDIGKPVDVEKNATRADEENHDEAEKRRCNSNNVVTKVSKRQV